MSPLSFLLSCKPLPGSLPAKGKVPSFGGIGKFSAEAPGLSAGRAAGDCRPCDGCGCGVAGLGAAAGAAFVGVGFGPNAIRGSELSTCEPSAACSGTSLNALRTCEVCAATG